MSFELVARVLKLPIKPTQKIILLAYADAANNDGTGAWPGNELIAQYAQCSVRSVQVHRTALIEDGYLREGDQAHPSLVSYPPDRRPIAFDVAVTAEQQAAWKAARAAGDRGLRDQYASAGRKGAAFTNGRGAESAPRTDADSAEPFARPSRDPRESATSTKRRVKGSIDGASTHERGEAGCAPGAKLAAPKPTPLTNPLSAGAALARHSASAASPLRSDADDTRPWRELLDAEDDAAIVDRIEAEVDFFDGVDQSMVEAMLARGCHPKMIINTIMVQRGTPTSPVTATVQRCIKLADDEIAAHGRSWSDAYRSRLEVTLRERVEAGWDDQQLADGIRDTVDAEVRRVKAAERATQVAA